VQYTVAPDRGLRYAAALMDVRVYPDAEALAGAAAELFRARVRARPDLAMAVPAGRTPRRMYALMQEQQAHAPVDFTRMSVFCVDELCPPAPADGYFWRQIRREFIAWAGVPLGRCRPFAVGAPDLEAMCKDYEASIAAAGGLDLVMLGLGWNAHIASHEPPADFNTVTCPVRLVPDTVSYILTDEVIQGEVCERAVTLGIHTILNAREVVMLVSGQAKRAALRATLHGPITPDAPASILQLHPNCLVLADAAASSD
jgi:glucosamine-6-phosphate deaminase